MSSSQTENDDEQFVVAAEKTVWVKETSDENGNVINSTLLSKNDSTLKINPLQENIPTERLFR